MALPIANGKVACAFGVKGTMWASGRHEGIDFVAADGTPVLAAANGVVKGIGTWGAAYGAHSVIVLHPGFGYAIYAHCSSALVKVGAAVTKGQHIANSGHEGNVTGPHLHLELQTGPGWVKGGGHDPAALLKA